MHTEHRAHTCRAIPTPARPCLVCTRTLLPRYSPGRPLASTTSHPGSQPEMPSATSGCRPRASTAAAAPAHMAHARPRAPSHRSRAPPPCGGGLRSQAGAAARLTWRRSTCETTASLGSSPSLRRSASMISSCVTSPMRMACVCARVCACLRVCVCARTRVHLCVRVRAMHIYMYASPRRCRRRRAHRRRRRRPPPAGAAPPTTSLGEMAKTGRHSPAGGLPSATSQPERPRRAEA